MLLRSISQNCLFRHETHLYDTGRRIQESSFESTLHYFYVRCLAKYNLRYLEDLHVFNENLTKNISVPKFVIACFVFVTNRRIPHVTSGLPRVEIGFGVYCDLEHHLIIIASRNSLLDVGLSLKMPRQTFL